MGDPNRRLMKDSQALQASKMIIIPAGFSSQRVLLHKDTTV